MLRVALLYLSPDFGNFFLSINVEITFVFFEIYMKHGLVEVLTFETIVLEAECHDSGLIQVNLFFIQFQVLLNSADVWINQPYHPVHLIKDGKPDIHIYSNC